MLLLAQPFFSLTVASHRRDAVTALLACPSCDSVILFPGVHSGETGPCPNCGQDICVSQGSLSSENLNALRQKIVEQCRRPTKTEKPDTRLDMK